MSDPEWWGSAHRPSFNGVISLSERLPFNPERGRANCIGSDATLDNCSAVGRANGMFTVFEASAYTDFLSDFTGIHRGDYELIAITEFLSLIACLMERAPDISGCVVCYVGDNQNVATWAKGGMPGHRVAKCLLIILNRLGNENNFTVIPTYISTMNNKLQDELPRPKHKEAVKFGQDRGLKYVDVGRTAKSYFGRRLGEFPRIPHRAISIVYAP